MWYAAELKIISVYFIIVILASLAAG